jgi:hypothetical protein
MLLTSAWPCAFVLSSPVAVADKGTDLHAGSFDATWCNYKATIDIESKESGKWVFHGHIRIKQTDQYDVLWVEQYQDNSLRMIRYPRALKAARRKSSRRTRRSKKSIRTELTKLCSPRNAATVMAATERVP